MHISFPTRVIYSIHFKGRVDKRIDRKAIPTIKWVVDMDRFPHDTMMCCCFTFTCKIHPSSYHPPNYYYVSTFPVDCRGRNSYPSSLAAQIYNGWQPFIHHILIERPNEIAIQITLGR